MLSGWRPRHYGGEPLEVGIVVWPAGHRIPGEVIALGVRWYLR